MASTLWLAVFLVTSIYSVFAANFTVVVNGTPSHAIPSTLCDVAPLTPVQSGDGGLYAELLSNRAFQQVTPNTAAALTPWSAVNGASIAVVNNTTALSTALPNSLQLTVPAGATGAVGVQNSGFLNGINVNASWTYNASFFYKLPTGSTFKGPFTVALKSTTGTTFATASIPVTAEPNVWTQVFVPLKPTTTPTTTTNVFTVTVDGASASSQTIFFTLFSLFPPTFKNRANGMRVDIATTLQEAGPSFFRFPGGNNLGQTAAQRWIWNNTIGPLTERPGRLGDWGYINTDGLGLLEYLNFIEDAGMQPIMAVWAGYSLNGASIAETGLAPFIQAAKDQIDFVIGDPVTNAMGAKRAAAGHPEPFTLNYVEVGNEDFFSTTYTYRWSDFVGNLSAAYPHITFIATGTTFDPPLTPNPKAWDIHVYQTPTWFAQNAFIYDGFQRNGTIYFEGEYAAISTNANDLFGAPSDGRLTFPTMSSSAGEAAFMTGFERNADIVFAASYAPLLGSVVSNQWTPNLVGFNANSVIRSTSYYTQQLFSLNRGDEYLPSTLPSRTGLTFWSVTRRTATNEILIKIANTDTAAATLTFELPFNTVARTGTATVLTGAATTSNTPTAPNTIVPKTSTIQIPGKRFSFTAAPISVNVLSVVAR
ncbi:glycoside hydrolase family 51 protein [Ramaria rubella]|nr:glycoside hydrolase family 51 protein [Ramaria rubella]